jgi:hypothetical protein
MRQCPQTSTGGIWSPAKAMWSGKLAKAGDPNSGDKEVSKLQVLCLTVGRNNEADVGAYAQFVEEVDVGLHIVLH